MSRLTYLAAVQAGLTGDTDGDGAHADGAEERQ